ncbi:paraplegin-like isoform X1 [Biomphalaria glabrata]|uniref:Paraplegin-like isoform X1 n=2 Tax=Biomphalaria glabrata TaxID=6526 RepID=A0A9W3AST4_BIOGL|nr:paraplegin-like isoform X1 [Biomphalaria glabrata]
MDLIKSMDKLLCKTLRPECLIKKVINLLHHRHLVEECIHNRYLKKKLSKTLISQLTTVQSQLVLTQRPESKILPALKKYIQVLSYYLIKSNRFPSNVHFSWINADINKYLYSSSENENQKKENKDESDKANRQEKPDDEEEEARKKMELMRSLFTFISVLVLAWILSPSSNDQSSNIKYISWSEFYHNILLKGEVKSIYIHFAAKEGEEDIAIIEVHEGAIIKGQPARGRFLIKIPKGFNFEEKIRQVEDDLNMPLNDRIPIRYGYSNSWVMLALQLAIGLVLFLFIRQIFTSMMKGKDGNVPDMMDFLSGGIRQAKFTRVDIASKGSKAVTFKDVAGLKEAKIELMEFVDYLTNPQRFKNLGAKTPRGALLLGPPGCGKTLLARALASEAKVPFLAMAGSEFVEMIGGVGAARVRNLFKEARNKAPCIIYIDEIDAIGRSRGGSASAGGEDEHTLNQLLVEMDGIETQEGVIMLAATNRADILDKALLRPGRFDRHIMIDLPTLKEREEIFTVYLNKLKLAQPAEAYAKALSRLTPGMSGADINNICNEAAIHAAREKSLFVDKHNFEYAVERVIAGVEKKTRLLSPTEKKVVAYHESGHALVGWMLKYTDALLRISIIPRTNSVLGFAQYLPSDQKLYSQEELFERMCMALGGRAAESLIFNHVSTGAHDDLQRVTKMAYDQIKSFGMSPKIGHLSFPSNEENPGLKPYSQRLAATIDEEARMLVTRAFLHTQAVLQEHKEKLHKLATTLLEKEVLTYEDILKLLGPPIHGKKNVIEPHGWEGIMPGSSNNNNTGYQQQ